MRYCSIHKLDFLVQCDACAASRDRKRRLTNLLYKEDIINTMVEAQRLADRVVDLAIAWHESDIGDCLDEAEALGTAIDELLEFRRKMLIVKDR